MGDVISETPLKALLGALVVAIPAAIANYTPMSPDDRRKECDNFLRCVRQIFEEIMAYRQDTPNSTAKH
jgi:hypothetical protein